MYLIGKKFRFAAAHSLNLVPEGHKCARMHGHNYQVTVTLAGHALDDQAMVMDYGELDLFKRYLEDTIDHRNLNTVVNFETTAENLAKFFHDVVGNLYQQDREWEVYEVMVEETENTFASYFPPELT